MSAMYSKAFDHMPGPQNENETPDYTYQDPELTANLSSFRRSGAAGGRSTAFRVKERDLKGDKVPDDDMGQGSSSEYVDVFDGQHRRGISHQQNSIHHRESEPVLRRGHRDEDSEEYCYAYTKGVSRDSDVTLRHVSLPAQRTVSLRDDYSQPPDRLSSSGSTQDYIEPYQSAGTKQNTATPVIQPDPGGIYELAKDVAEIRETGPPDRSGIVSDHYNHLNDVQGTLNKTNLADKKLLEERYDHVQSWSSRVKPLSSIDSGTEHYVSAESSPQRKCSNISDDVFMNNSAMNKISQNVYRDLPANYEEPWDSQEGQKRFDSLISKAEKKHVSRQSFDQSAQSSVRKVSEQPEGRVNIVKKTVNQTPKVNQTGNSEVYEAAWAGSTNQRGQAGSSGQRGQVPAPAPTQTKAPSQHRPSSQSNYEDAWDLPEKQKELEEKLLQARKQRTSQGQIREEDESTASEGRSSRVLSGSSPTMQKTEPFKVIRSDSCRSLGALAEKIDKSISLEEQCFYHGSIKRSAAEKTLLVFKEGSYLIRRSETSKKDFSLTLKGWNGQPMHMKIACKPDGTYVLGENSPPFQTIPEMVDYYTTHELPVQNADRICLLYPIPC